MRTLHIMKASINTSNYIYKLFLLKSIMLIETKKYDTVMTIMKNNHTRIQSIYAYTAEL